MIDGEATGRALDPALVDRMLKLVKRLASKPWEDFLDEARAIVSALDTDTDEAEAQKLIVGNWSEKWQDATIAALTALRGSFADPAVRAAIQAALNEKEA